MDYETVSILCSPYTRNPLDLITEQKQDGTTEEILVDVKTGERFPFRNGVPILYDVLRLEGYNLQYNTFYRKAAMYYDLALRILALLNGSSEAKFRSQYLQLLEIKKDSKVLEVSVGTGTNLSLLPASTRTCGLDLSWEMLSKCQKNMLRWNRKFELFFGNSEILPFRDAMFDVVFHVGGINAFSDRAKAISEMIRVARPGTKIVIVDETSKMMKSLSWIPSAKKMLKEWDDRFEAPINLVPATMREIHINYLVKDFFYVLSFRKP